jgi:hypothetical protein
MAKGYIRYIKYKMAESAPLDPRSLIFPFKTYPQTTLLHMGDLMNGAPIKIFEHIKSLFPI